MKTVVVCLNMNTFLTWMTTKTAKLQLQLSMIFETSVTNKNVIVLV